MEKLNYSKAKTEIAIKKNKHNGITTWYYLLLNKMLKTPSAHHAASKTTGLENAELKVGVKVAWVDEELKNLSKKENELEESFSFAETLIFCRKNGNTQEVHY